MTAAAFRRLLKRLEISQLEAARRLGRDPRTIRRWVSGQAPVPKAAERLLQTFTVPRKSSQ